MNNLVLSKLFQYSILNSKYQTAHALLSHS